MGKASSFGDMFEQSIKACATHELGDAETAATHLAYVIENKDDNVSALMETYVCMGMEDEAAALLIERLQDPNRADQALWSIHSRYPYPVQQDYHETLKATYARIHAREDVQDAAAAVGTIIDLPIYNIYWGNN